MEWIVIPKWDEFQHYKNRDPAWIKLHRTLASDPAWIELSGHCRAVLVGLWLEYASSNCQVAVNTSSLTRRLGLRVSSRQLKTLETAGFIEVSASKPLAQCYSRGRERDRERKNLGNPPKPKANGHAKTCPVCHIVVTPPTTVLDHMHQQHDQVAA